MHMICWRHCLAYKPHVTEDLGFINRLLGSIEGGSGTSTVAQITHYSERQPALTFLWLMKTRSPSGARLSQSKTLQMLRQVIHRGRTSIDLGIKTT
jgi:hypothetical protein